MEASSPQGPKELSTQAARAESDLQLVSAVLRKDRKATAEFVALHAAAIYGYVRHRLIPRLDLVDDIVQEVFLAAWDDLANFRGQAALRTWLLSIARHKVEDYYRRQLREPERLASEHMRDPETSAVHTEPEELIDKHRVEEKIRMTLASLPETYSIALLWRYWEKRSAREIAAATGRTEKAVERLLARARAQFKKKWNNG